MSTASMFEDACGSAAFGSRPAMESLDWPRYLEAAGAWTAL